ncbi:hypothetical protein ACQPX6_22390 [Actinomycetospora sp. CA-101289]|uniref:hypothetical protein n=1 Tax=Actinomycetospora sp. CA-101289 TaxID=3239893 RepID=UPI003D995D9F
MSLQQGQPRDRHRGHGVGFGVRSFVVTHPHRRRAADSRCRRHGIAEEKGVPEPGPPAGECRTRARSPFRVSLLIDRVPDLALQDLDVGPFLPLRRERSPFRRPGAFDELGQIVNGGHRGSSC